MLRWAFVILFILLCISPTRAEQIHIGPGFTEKTLNTTYRLPGQQKNKDLHFYYSIVNSQDKPAQVYLSIINPTIDLVDVTVTDGKTRRMFVLGDDRPFTKRILKHYNLVLPLEIGPGRELQVSLLIHSQLEPLNFSVNLAEQKTFIKRTNHDNLFMGAFYGFFFMFLLLLICFYIFSKSKFFIIYFVINLVTILIFMLYNGTGYQYVWFYSPLAQKLLPVLLATSYLSAHVYFIRRFFNVEIRYIRFNKFINLFLFLAVGIIIFSLVLLFKDAQWNTAFSDYYWIICTLFIIYGFLVLGISLFTYIKTRKREAIWVFIGACIQFLNWIIFIENIYGSAELPLWIAEFQVFPSHIFIPHFSFLLIIGEIFMVSYFITINYHTLIRQNDISAKRLGFLQQRNINTFILGQEETREHITRFIENSILYDILQSEAKTRKLIHLENADRIESILQDYTNTINDLNNITSNYVAPDMQNIDLRTLVQTAMDKLYLEKEVTFDFSEVYKSFTMNVHANTHLYRILQEVSNNIIKHARAEKIHVNLFIRNKFLVIEVKDDGVGMNIHPKAGKGIGLINIESRIRSLNGTFRIESTPNNGTTYIFELPVKDIA